MMYDVSPKMVFILANSADVDELKLSGSSLFGIIYVKQKKDKTVIKL